MPLHSSLTDPELHEPKGISTATVAQVYKANGSGSGTWQKVYTQGFEDYHNTGGSQALAITTWTDLNNNGLGVNTSNAYKLPGGSALWNTSTNSLSFTSLSLGDTVDVRIDLNVTTVGTNQEIALRFDLAHGVGAEYTVPIARGFFKTAGTYQIASMMSIYMGNADTRDNPGKIAIWTDGASNSVTVNGWYIRVIPRNPIFSA